MAITIISTPGAIDANSYVTLAEADIYLEASLNAESWTALDDERKKAALAHAARLIESLRFGGLKSTATQSLEWPREGVFDRNGYYVNGVPSKLKDAQCEIAIWELNEPDRLAGRFELETMEAVKIGPINYNVAPGAPVLPSYITNMLMAIGPGAVKDPNSSTVSRFTL